MDEQNSRQGQDRDGQPAPGPKRTVSKGYTSKAQSAGKAHGAESTSVDGVPGPAGGAITTPASPLPEVKPRVTKPAEPSGDHKTPEVKPMRPPLRGSDPYHADRRPMDPIIPIPGGPSLKGTEGAVKWFDPRKGFGFIVGPEGQDIFVHYTIIEGDGFRVLKDGSAVVYDAVKTEKGWKATRVMRVEGAEPGEITTAPRRGYTRTPRR